MNKTAQKGQPVEPAAEPTPDVAESPASLNPTSAVPIALPQQELSEPVRHTDLDNARALELRSNIESWVQEADRNSYRIAFLAPVTVVLVHMARVSLRRGDIDIAQARYERAMSLYWNRIVSFVAIAIVVSSVTVVFGRC